MISVRKKDERGATETGWLTSRHSFSFGHYYDPAYMGFGPLRVINEDWVAPGTGFDTHGHKNMEIITYVLKGSLAHKDSTTVNGATNAASIVPGEVQVMSAGKGILHSEYNGSATEDVHLLQIWIMPDEINTHPGYQQKPFAAEDMRNRFRLIVSQDGAEGSLIMKQDARLYAGRFEAGAAQSISVEKNRKYWLQVACGDIDVSARSALDFGGESFEAGDGLAVAGEEGMIDILARTDAEVLLFDLPQ